MGSYFILLIFIYFLSLWGPSSLLKVTWVKCCWLSGSSASGSFLYHMNYHVSCYLFYDTAISLTRFFFCTHKNFHLEYNFLILLQAYIFYFTSLRNLILSICSILCGRQVIWSVLLRKEITGRQTACTHATWEWRRGCSLSYSCKKSS